MMKKIIILLAFLFPVLPVFAQSAFRAIIKDKLSDFPLAGVNVLVEGTLFGATSDSAGFVVIKNIPDGKRNLSFSFVGYKKLSLEYDFPLKTSKPEVIFMEENEESLKEVVISSNRTQRAIEDIPIRIEAVVGEELDEKLSVKASDITKLLTEATGIQVQQTSAFSGSAVIRMQGLDGKYTQILKDGFPLYDGFSGSLSILQVPPLDLSQVEIIKGSASTLYGGGAIAGLVNLISRIPHHKPEFNLVMNASNRQGLDGSAYYSSRNDKTGVSLLVNVNEQKPYDVNGDNFSDIPGINSYSINPRLFYYLDNTATLSFAINQFFERRKGGMISYINNTDDPNALFEFNTSKRFSTELGFVKTTEDHNLLSIKNGLSSFNRSVERKLGYFQAEQFSTFSEVSYLIKQGINDIVTGINFQSDRVEPKDNIRPEYIKSGIIGESYSNYTLGLFAQIDWNVNEKLIIEPGFRIDYNRDEKFFLLPSLYAVYKFNKTISTRFGGGMGYKLPSIFSQEDENLFKLIRTFDKNLKAEKSFGLGCDFNFKGMLTDELSYQFNQSFYLTNIENPLILEASPFIGPEQLYYFINADKPYETRGFESNFSLSMEDIKLFMGYHFSHAIRKFEPVNTNIPLNPGQSFWLDFAYEEEGEFRAAFEAYYTGKQFLDNGAQTIPYWTLGILLEKKITDYLNLFVNLENFTDTRLDKLAPAENNGISPYIYSNEIWAPQEGFVLNGGVRLRL